jgi:DNA replication protein DnaC
MSAPAGIYEQIKADLGYLKLTRAAEVFGALLEQAKTDGWTHAQTLAAVLAAEASATAQRRLDARLRFAHFPVRRTLADFDFDFQPSLDRDLLADLATLRFVADGRPVLFLGQPGCGKTHLAIALGVAAVEAGYRGYFTTATDLVATIAAAYRDGTFEQKIKTYTGPSVLVIDDVGLTPLDRGAGNAFFQVLDRRYNNGSSTIVTTNRGLPGWGELFGDAVLAAAILDRLLHRAAVFNIKGPSWRLREHQNLISSPLRDTLGPTGPAR